MRDPIAIVESAADAQQIAREILAAIAAEQTAEAELKDAERKTASLRATQARRRVEVGRLLIDAKRVVKRGQWEPYLEKLGIASQRASEYMRCAEHAGLTAFARRSQSPSFDDAGDLAPTLFEAGIDKRPRLEADHVEDVAIGGSTPVSQEPSYESDEWYTPMPIVEMAREVLGEIDLDPASCEFAQSRIRAARFYTKDDDGLAHEWRGRVWMNPPYSNPLATKFADKLLAEYNAERVTEAIVIQNCMASSGWFQRLASAGTICLPRKRIQFDRRDGRTDHHNNHSQVIFYLGDRGDRFAEVFAKLGLVGELRSDA